VGFHPDANSVYADGYIRVVQNIRGRFESEGEFEMNRPPRSLSNPKATDEVTDAWDSIDWLVKNVPNNNGRVGIAGTSYDGWLVMEAALNPHPALKAAVEQASPEDMFANDDFHHNGAFRLSYGFEYSALLETSKAENHDFKFDRGDTYDWYLSLGALSNADANYFHGTIPTWENFVEHPNRDAFWKERALITYVGEPKVPILHVSGWWDQEDIVGPQTLYNAMEKHDPQHRNYFIAGPWKHGQWGGTGLSLGPIQFGSDTRITIGSRFTGSGLPTGCMAKVRPTFLKRRSFRRARIAGRVTTHGLHARASRASASTCDRPENFPSMRPATRPRRMTNMSAIQRTRYRIVRVQ
jgi:putative CocE/NonD family hydrolase